MWGYKYSKIIEPMFGEAYIQHYDNNYKKVATTHINIPIFGEWCWKHYFSDGKYIGKSILKSKLVGGQYIEHFDDYDKSIGISYLDNSQFIEVLLALYKQHEEVINKPDLIAQKKSTTDPDSTRNHKETQNKEAPDSTDYNGDTIGWWIKLLFIGLVVIAILGAIIDPYIIDIILSQTALSIFIAILIIALYSYDRVLARKNSTKLVSVVTHTTAGLLLVLALEPAIYFAISGETLAKLLLFITMFIPYVIAGVYFGQKYCESKDFTEKDYIEGLYKYLGYIYGMVHFLCQYRDIMLNLDGLFMRIIFSIFGLALAGATIYFLVKLGLKLFKRTIRTF